MTEFFNMDHRTHTWPTLGMGWWLGRSIPCVGLGSLFPAARPRGMARIRGSSPRHWCPFQRRPLNDHPRHQPTRRYWRPGHWGAGADLTLMFRGAEWIPVWWRQCPHNSWHVACCLCEIMLSVKLLYSRKTVWCWLPHGCADQLPEATSSEQSAAQPIDVSVPEKRWNDTADRPPTSGSTTPGCAKSYDVAVQLMPLLSQWLKLHESSSDYWNLSHIPSWKSKLRIFKLCLTSLIYTAPR